MKTDGREEESANLNLKKNLHFLLKFINFFCRERNIQRHQQILHPNTNRLDWCLVSILNLGQNDFFFFLNFF